MKTGIHTAVFPVAGLGTRFLPATKAVPKEMLPVIDRPLIEHAVCEARSAGIQKFVFIVPAEGSLVRAHFSENVQLELKLDQKNLQAELAAIRDISLKPNCMFFAVQKQPLGLGHAILLAKPYIEESSFAVILPDDLVLSSLPCIRQLINTHVKTGGSVLAVEKVEKGRLDRYGIVDTDLGSSEVAQVRSIVEKPQPKFAPSNLAVVGRYILSREIFSHLQGTLPGVGGEIQVTDAINSLAQVQPVFALQYRGKRYDCGSKVGFLSAIIDLARRDHALVEAIEQNTGCKLN